jgi:hypothetical protein
MSVTGGDAIDSAQIGSTTVTPKLTFFKTLYHFEFLFLCYKIYIEMLLQILLFILI